MTLPASIRKIVKHKYKYLMLLPGFAAIFLFCYVPMYGLYIAFAKYKIGKPILSSKFMGLLYFKTFFQDSMDFPNLLRNTICMNLLVIVIGLVTALALAIMLNEVRLKFFKRIVQTASFFPFFISWVIVYNIFNTFLAANSGIVNVAMVDLGLIREGINYLGEPRFAWPIFVVSSIWKSLGYNSVIFLASIASIDTTMYEAAEIDGADRLQRIWHITIPSLAPTAQILLILSVGSLFSSNLDQYYLFTNGMNREMMEVFDMYIYRLGLVNLDFSYSTAVGIAKAVAGFILMYAVNFISKRMGGSGLL